MMRKGSVTIVPLFIAMMLLVWFMMTMGVQNDQLRVINQVQNLQHLQDRLMLAAITRKYELKKANPTWSDAQVDIQVNQYIETMIQANGYDKE